MNAFGRLGLDVRLVISEEEIRNSFRKKAGVLHPDSGGDEKEFSELQLAQEILLSPARRLKEWMGAESVEADARGQIGAGLMDLFQKVAEIGNAAEATIKVGAGAQSSLAKAMAEVKLMGERERVKSLLAEIAGEIGKRIAAFPEIEEGEADPGKVMRELIFLEKWRASMKSVYGRLM
ncbi:MAG: DnaJ domain-containing protein [Akkermansiaceae bacterium]|nr:DnaJ domain-containing protein [Akkermansiaceae bacterium]